MAVARPAASGGLCRGMPYFPRLDLLKSLAQRGVRLLPERGWSGSCCPGSGAVRPGRNVKEEADTCVIALGVRADTTLLDQLREKYPLEVLSAGDVDGGANLYDATHSAHFCGPAHPVS